MRYQIQSIRERNLPYHGQESDACSAAVFMAGLPPELYERKRLAALFALDLLQGPREPILDRLVRLAQSEFGTQSAAIVLIDRTTAIFQSKIGTNARRCPRDVWPCNLAIRGPEPLILQDLRQDSRFDGLAAVAGAPEARSYAGFPLVTREGLAIGTLAVFDPRPGRIPEDRAGLGMALAALVMDAIGLHQLASRDPLTGVLNRRGFMEQYEREVQHCWTEGAALSLIMMDIDHFKSVNDRFGHPAGDEVLRKVSRQLADVPEESALVGRLGGEEFAILLRASQDGGARSHAESLRLGIEMLRFESVPELMVSASFGIAELGEHTRNAAQLLARADAALYDAKTSGRNRVVCASVVTPN